MYKLTEDITQILPLLTEYLEATEAVLSVNERLHAAHAGGEMLLPLHSSVAWWTDTLACICLPKF